MKHSSETYHLLRRDPYSGQQLNFNRASRIRRNDLHEEPLSQSIAGFILLLFAVALAILSLWIS